MLRIADIMTEEVFTVPAGASAEEVAWALAIRNIGGAPVRDARGRLIGTVGKAELVDPHRGAWPRDGGRGRPPIARDLMSPRLLVARADDPAMWAVELFVRERTSQILVVDGDDGAVVGIVTPTDVLRALARGDRVTDDRAGAEVDDHGWERGATAPT